MPYLVAFFEVTKNGIIQKSMRIRYQTYALQLNWVYLCRTIVRYAILSQLHLLDRQAAVEIRLPPQRPRALSAMQLPACLNKQAFPSFDSSLHTENTASCPIIIAWERSRTNVIHSSVNLTARFIPNNSSAPKVSRTIIPYSITAIPRPESLPQTSR